MNWDQPDPRDPPRPAYVEKNPWRLVGWVFLGARCPSCHPIISVKALKGTLSTDQWPGLNLFFPQTPNGRGVAPCMTPVPKLHIYSNTSITLLLLPLLMML